MADDLYTRFVKAEKFFSDMDRVVRECSRAYGISERRIKNDLENRAIKGSPDDYGYSVYSIRMEILMKSYGTLETKKEGTQRTHQDIQKSSSHKIREVFCGKIEYSQDIIDEYKRMKEYVDSILSYDGVVKAINQNFYQESLFGESDGCFMYCGNRENEVVFCESPAKVEQAKRHDLEMLISGLEPEKKAFFEKIFGERIADWDKYYKPQ